MAVLPQKDICLPCLRYAKAEPTERDILRDKIGAIAERLMKIGYNRAREKHPDGFLRCGSGFDRQTQLLRARVGKAFSKDEIEYIYSHLLETIEDDNLLLIIQDPDADEESWLEINRRLNRLVPAVSLRTPLSRYLEKDPD